MLKHLPKIMILLAVLVVMHASPAASTGIGALSGNFMSRGAQETGLRQQVTLSRQGSLYIGRPLYGSVRLITLELSGVERSSIALILREMDAPEGAKTILLTATDAVQNAVKRGTLFINAPPASLVLTERHNENWIFRHPQFTIPAKAPTSPAMLAAFSIERLGFYNIISQEVGSQYDLSGNYNNSSPEVLLGGNLHQSLLPWLLSAIALIVISVASRWAYWMSQRRRKM